MKAMITKDYIMDLHQIKPMFTLLKANVVRMRIPISALFLTLSQPPTIGLDRDVEEEITRFLQGQKRETDLFFPFHTPTNGVLFFPNVKRRKLGSYFNVLGPL